MFCPQCATENPEKARFCRKCGCKIGASPEVKKTTPESKIGKFFKWIGYIVVGMILLGMLSNC